MPTRKTGASSRTPPPLNPAPAKPAEAGTGGGGGYSSTQQRRPTTPSRDPRVEGEGYPPKVASATVGGHPPSRSKTPRPPSHPPPKTGGREKTKMPTLEEERETSAKQEQKSRESALRFEKIRTENDREKEMATIIRGCLAEAARGPLHTHITRLIQLRSCGNHNGEHNWVKQITAFKKRFPREGPSRQVPRIC